MNERQVSGSGEGPLSVTYWVWPEAVREGAFAHLQTFKAHVKVASMEGVCDCIGQFSSS